MPAPRPVVATFPPLTLWLIRTRLVVNTSLSFTATVSTLYPLTSMSTLGLVVLFLVIVASLSIVKPHWIPHAVAYLLSDSTRTVNIVALIHELEGWERELQKPPTHLNAAEPLPEDYLRRMAKLKGLIRR